MHPEFGPIALISALSLFLPLPWHWRSGNVATLCIIGWLFVTNLIFAIDAFIWSNNVEIIASIWCDISTKLIIGANFALPATCLCICIHLEQISSVRHARTTISDKTRRQIFEAGMCIGLPMIFMTLHYIIQGHRFDIIEGYGCRPATYFSVASIFIIWIPPIVMSVAAIIYAGLALRHFMVRRLSFASHLQASNSALTTSRYIRLMTMAAVQMAWSITATSYALWFTVMSIPIRPWTTWADVHSDFLRIDQYPDALIPIFVKRAFNVLWWFIPSSTFIFVAFFAFGKDATDEYRKCLVWVRVKVFRQPIDTKNSKGSFSIMPIFRSKPAQGLSISKPIPQDMANSNNLESSLPPYSASRSSFCSTSKSPGLSHYDDCDIRSEDTRYEHSPYAEGKAIGSYTDLSVHTPSTAGPFTMSQNFLPETNLELPHHPPLPLTPPPTNPRLRALILGSPSLARPLTYPSFDLSPGTTQPPKSFSQ